jgi:hypothetical protein
MSGHVFPQVTDHRDVLVPDSERRSPEASPSDWEANRRLLDRGLRLSSLIRSLWPDSWLDHSLWLLELVLGRAPDIEVSPGH